MPAECLQAGARALASFQIPSLTRLIAWQGLVTRAGDPDSFILLSGPRPRKREQLFAVAHTFCSTLVLRAASTRKSWLG